MLSNSNKRYEGNASNNYDRSQRSFHTKLILCSIFVMFSIFCGLFTIFIISQVSEETTAANSTVTTFKSSAKQQLPANHIKQPNQLLHPGIEMFEVHGNNESRESVTKKLKTVESSSVNELLPSPPSPESQKLVFLPSHSLKPPKSRERPRRVHHLNLPNNHRISSRMWTSPRPYNQHLSGTQVPSSFQTTQKPFTQSINNILEAMNQNMLADYSRKHQDLTGVRLAGTYRHPKNRDIEHLDSNRHQEVQNDPFYNYKMPSPYELNQMISGFGSNYLGTPTNSINPYRQKNRLEVASIPNYSIGYKDGSRIYSNLMRQNKRNQKADRPELPQKGKPYQLTLDVFPEDLRFGSNVPILPTGTAAGNINRYTKVLAGLPNTQPKTNQDIYPINTPAYMNNNNAYSHMFQRYPVYFGYNQNQNLNTLNSLQNANRALPQSSNINLLKVLKPNLAGLVPPSQLIVHLNLYPKNKSSSQRSMSNEYDDIKRVIPMMATTSTTTTTEAPHNKSMDNTGIPLNINFNVNTGNGAGESIHHQFTLPRDSFVNEQGSSRNSTAPVSFTTDSTLGSYYYDDEDDDQSIQMSPSNMVYHNIVRDRPRHLMLKNTTKPGAKSKGKKPSTSTPTTSTTMATPQSSAVKYHQKLTYQSIDRSKKRQTTTVRPLQRAYNFRGFL